jgi:acetolactate synthase I/II/III large subunit
MTEQKTMPSPGSTAGTDGTSATDGQPAAGTDARTGGAATTDGTAATGDTTATATANAAATGDATATERVTGRHVPNAGTVAAAEIERARSSMLSDARPRDRTRIGADALCEALIHQGVDVIFGYPGGVILPLYDVWDDHPRIRHVLVRHEQGAAHAADGYARASGRVGVCLGTSGPGATNLVTGIATAQLDSIPIVAITGNVPGALIGKDAFQEIDISGITLPMTKHNYLVRSADDIPRVIAEAFHIARTGRPGPVHVDITKDALTTETRAGHPDVVDLPGFKPTFEGHPRQVRLAAQDIASARRPVILAGHGVLLSGAVEELMTFARKTQIPVTHTLLGIGCIDERDPLSYGYMGMHGWKHVNRAIQSADLLIALGMRFDDRVTGKVSTYAPHARIIHVDIDPSEIGKNVAVDVPIVGDVKRVLRALINAVQPVDPADRAEYFAQLAEWRSQSEGASWHGSGAWRDGHLSADYVISRLGELTDHDATFVADVGQHQMWLARYAGFRRPDSHLSSGGLGTMGYALPAAMGAALGRPDKETWAVAGDGGLQMTAQELMTVAADRIPVKIALLDNKKLGMIRQWQEIIYGGNYHSSHLPGPDWAKLAEAYGVPWFRASKPDEVDGVIRAAQAVDGPALVWFETAETQNVFPMMPAGKGLSDLIETWGESAEG